MSSPVPAPSGLTSPAPAASTELLPLAPRLPEPEPGGGFNLASVLVVLRRRRRLALVVGGAVFGMGALLATGRLLLAPVYEGSFQLLISDPITSAASQGADAAGGVVESLARNRTSTNIPTLIQTLTSPVVLAQVRDKLPNNRVDLAGVRIVQPASGQRSASVDGVLQVSLRGRQPAELQQALETLSDTYLAFALSQRRERLAEGLRFLSQQEPVLTERVNALQASLAEFRRANNLLAPETEAAALKQDGSGLEQQQRGLEAERDRLLRLRQGVARGQLIAGGFSTGGGSGSADSSAGGVGGGDGVAVSQADSDKLQQLQQLDSDLAKARSVYRDDAPRLRSLVAQRAQLMAELRANQLEALDTALSLNATRVRTLQQQSRSVDRQFLRQPALIQSYEELQQQLKVAQDNLANFLSTRSTFQLEQAQNTVPWKVIAPPSVLGWPVEPDLGRSLLQALVLGAAAGVGAALLRDRFDHVFHHPGEVRDDLREPLLGTIPHVALFQGVRGEAALLLEELDRTAPEPEGQKLQSRERDPRERRSQRFYYQEALRNLYTSLRFLNSERPLRSVALTSSLPAEGKSLVNVLLAKTLADLGQRVLIVDADLRKPQLHHRLGVNNLRGLSNLLSGDADDWRQLIQPVPRHSNWWVLSAGRRPPDPARLLSSARLAKLVRELADSGQFDLILYDTPPALGLADAALVAEHLDGLMLLVSLNRVDRSLPAEAIDRIRSAGAPLLGVVTNAVTDSPTPQGGYGYGYGRYGYGRYGYGGYGYGGYGVGDYSATYAHYDTAAPAQPQRPAPQRGPARLWQAGQDRLGHFWSWLNR